MGTSFLYNILQPEVKMPCRDGRDNETETERYQSSCLTSLHTQLEVLKKQHKKDVDYLESLLCSVCRVLEESEFDFGKNPRLDDWWHDHKKEDSKKEKLKLKKESEEAKNDFRKRQAIIVAKKPINELTVEDKKLLKEQGYL